MSNNPPSFELFGRETERAALDALVADVRSGQSRVLVLAGEAGVGKTALLDYVRSSAAGCEVSYWAGVELEAELPYAGLRELCTPFFDRIDRLPDPQQDALMAAIGLRAGMRADQFFVGLAALHLLADAADDKPIICIIDDVHWLDRDSVQVLVFVARRLLAERIGFVFAVRDAIPDEFRGLAELPVRGLNEAAARDLLKSAVSNPVDIRVRDRIIAEAHGNPLALLELPSYDTAADWAGYAQQAVPLAGRIEKDVLHRIGALDAPVRQLLLIASAEPLGDPTILWRAVDHLGIDRGVAGCAQDTGLIEIGTQIRFRHPLIRSAVYRTATPDERRGVHDCLADVTDVLTDPDRCAWHQSLAVIGPDEAVAAALEAGAERARSRGGLAAVATFLERATQLTPNRDRRCERALAAAQAKRDAGLLDDAESLLRLVDAGSTDPTQTAQAHRLRGQLAFDRGRGAEASGLLLSAAEEFSLIDTDLAREAHLEALAAAMWAGGTQTSDVLIEASRAARTAPPISGDPRVSDLMLDALAVRFTDGYAAASAGMARALDAARRAEVDEGDVGRLLWIVGNRVSGIIATELWDYDAGRELATRQVRIARESCALMQLQFAVNFLANHEVLAGRLDQADVLIDEDRRIAKVTGNPPLDFTAAMLAAFRGDEAATRATIAATSPALLGRGRIVSFYAYVEAVLDNALGRYEEACAAAAAVLDADTIGYCALAVGELAEAAARIGDERRLAEAGQWIAERAAATPTPWARGIEARVRALLVQGEEADALYRASIEALAPTQLRVDCARSRLLYGEWLRREGRRLEARNELTAAFDEFNSMGMAGFEERARRELTATGAAPRKRSDVSTQDLTAQEAQIAQLAREGFSNVEIGTRLFLSPRTVEWHLGKVFGKLGITSRRQLRNFETPGVTFSRQA